MLKPNRIWFWSHFIVLLEISDANNENVIHISKEIDDQKQWPNKMMIIRHCLFYQSLIVKLFSELFLEMFRVLTSMMNCNDHTDNDFTTN